MSSFPFFAGGVGPAAIVLAAAAVSAQPVPDAPPASDRPEVQVTPEIAERCNREGGCDLVTKRYLQLIIHMKQQEALQEGFRRGLAEGIQQGCRRKDI